MEPHGLPISTLARRLDPEKYADVKVEFEKTESSTSWSKATHKLHLPKVLGRLWENCLTISSPFFGHEEVKFLWHCVSSGIRLLPSHVEAVLAFSCPFPRLGLQWFLGLANFYYLFLHYAAGFLLSLKGFSTALAWTSPMDQAFAAAKARLSAATSHLHLRVYLWYLLSFWGREFSCWCLVSVASEVSCLDLLPFLDSADLSAAVMKCSAIAALSQDLKFWFVQPASSLLNIHGDLPPAVVAKFLPSGFNTLHALSLPAAYPLQDVSAKISIAALTMCISSFRVVALLTSVSRGAQFTSLIQVFASLSASTTSLQQPIILSPTDGWADVPPAQDGACGLPVFCVLANRVALGPLGLKECATRSLWRVCSGDALRLTTLTAWPVLVLAWGPT